MRPLLRSSTCGRPARAGELGGYLTALRVRGVRLDRPARQPWSDELKICHVDAVREWPRPGLDGRVLEWDLS